MSCEIRLAACLEDVSNARKCLFPLDNQNGSDKWLHPCKISISPTGNLIVLANERKIVVFTQKGDSACSVSSYQIHYSGPIHDYDKVKAILCIAVVGQNDNSALGSEWTCIIVGFDSGYVRFYTENCDLIYEEQFHAENIRTITCRSQHSNRSDIATCLKPEEIYIHYQSIICALNGSQLISILRFCHNQSSEYNRDSLSISPTKWGFQEQSVLNDSAIVGLTGSNTFDHLLTASTCGGFHSKYRAMPPNSTLVVAAGSKPYLGFHYALEGGGQPVLSDVAKAVASKLKSTLPSWLMGNKSAQERQMSLASQPSDPMGYRFGICDLKRTATDINLSPDHKLATICDSLGRILLIDCFKGVVLKIFKGYREAQCCFIQVPDEKKSKHKAANRIAHFLVIYSPKKGTAEIFSLQGTRIAIFSASKYSSLLYFNYGLVGLSQTTKPKYIPRYTTLFIDNSGLIKEFVVPFHLILSEKSNKRARDVHLFRKFRHLIKTNEFEEESLLKESLNLCTELKTTEVKCQFVDLLLENKNIPVEVSLKCVQFLLENLEDDSENLKKVCQNSLGLLKLYEFLFESGCNEDTEDNNEFSKNIEIKEMANLQKLLDVNIVNVPEVHIKFLDPSELSAAEFLSIFNYSSSASKSNLEPHVMLKPNIDPHIMFKISEAIFKPYIEGKLKNFEGLKSKLIESKVPTKNLFDLLLTYWINRSFIVSSSLAEEINKLLILINIIVRISQEDIHSTEYCEISEFWTKIRNILVDSSKPFPALVVAILCKHVSLQMAKVGHLDESGTNGDDMEMLTQEDIEWTLLIGKLEDISLLNIILSVKPSTEDCPLPKLRHDKVEISLKYILQKGSGSVSELVAQWLTTIGVNPENIVLNDSVHCQEISENQSEENSKNSLTDDKLFCNLNLIRKQFPYSLQANYILTNMSWEYATAWQKDMQNLSLLQASISCLKNIASLQIKQGLYQLIWNTHLKIVNENTCKLINKVGKLPNERLCKQDTGLTDYQVSLFLSISNDFLSSFSDTVKETYDLPKEDLRFENIWESSDKSLVELAMQQKYVNFELLFLHYQLSWVLLMISSFSIRHPKPINHLFEASVVNLFFTDLQRKLQISSNKSDVRLNSSRKQFLFKIISASLESITINESGKIYSTDHVFWMSKCLSLGKIWNLDVDELRRYQIVQLYTTGYDSIAEELIPAVNDSRELGKDLLIIAAKRLSQFLVSSPLLSENISALSTVLTTYMESLTDEWCAPSPLKDITTLATHIVYCLTEDDSEYKLSALLLDACGTLEAV